MRCAVRVPMLGAFLALQSWPRKPRRFGDGTCNDVRCNIRQVRVEDAIIIVFDGMSIDANRDVVGVEPNRVRAVSTSSRQPRRCSGHSSRPPCGGFPRPSALRHLGRPGGPSQQLVVFE